MLIYTAKNYRAQFCTVNIRKPLENARGLTLEWLGHKLV